MGVCNRRILGAEIFGAGILGASLALALLASAPARAALLPFTGTFSMRLASSDPVVVTASGTLEVNGSGGGPALHSLALAADAFETAGEIVAITDPGVFPLLGLQLVMGHDAGAFDVAPLEGTLPLRGSFKACLYGGCGSSLNIANLSVPLSVVGRQDAIVAGGAVQFTVAGAPWTTGTAALGTATAMGFVASAGGGSGHTATQGGHVRLVTPTLFQSAIGAYSFVPVMSTLDLHFVPEPTTLALLGAGIAALSAAGMRRRDRSVP